MHKHEEKDKLLQYLPSASDGQTIGSIKRGKRIKFCYKIDQQVSETFYIYNHFCQLSIMKLLPLLHMILKHDINTSRFLSIRIINSITFEPSCSI